MKIKYVYSKNTVHSAVVKFSSSGCCSDEKRLGWSRKITSQNEHVVSRIAVQSPSEARKFTDITNHKAWPSTDGQLFDISV